MRDAMRRAIRGALRHQRPPALPPRCAGDATSPQCTYVRTNERTNEDFPTSQRILTLRNAHARIPKIGFIALTPDSAS